MIAGSENPFEGQRVLIVEDVYLIASLLKQEVEALGGEVVGPFGRTADARAALAGAEIGLALLDINLGAETIYVFAEELKARGTPFIFMTGYSEGVLPEAWRSTPRLEKPLNTASLAATASAVLREAR